MKKPIVSVLRTTPGLDDHALFMALLRSGREVINFDDRQFVWHEAPNMLHRIARRLNRLALGRAMNFELIKYILACRPSLFIVFKHPLLSRDVLEAAKSVGARTVCIYPDIDPLVHGPGYVAAATVFDDFLHTKPNLVEYFREHVNSRARLIGPFYDPASVGAVLPIDPNIGVSFVGHHSPGKQKFLGEFSRLYRGRLTVVGDRWSRFMFNKASANVHIHDAIYGLAAYKLYRRSVCSLGLLMESVSTRTSDDEVTSRTVLVPAYGGLLLHVRSKAAEDVFGTDSGVLFDTIEHAARLVQAIEADPELRSRLATQQQAKALAFGTDVNRFVQELLCD